MGEESVSERIMGEDFGLEQKKSHLARQFKGRFWKEDYFCRKQKEWLVNDVTMPIIEDKSTVKLLEVLKRLKLGDVQNAVL